MKRATWISAKVTTVNLDEYKGLQEKMTRAITTLCMRICLTR